MGLGSLDAMRNRLARGARPPDPSPLSGCAAVAAAALEGVALALGRNCGSSALGALAGVADGAGAVAGCGGNKAALGKGNGGGRCVVGAAPLGLAVVDCDASAANVGMTSPAPGGSRGGSGGGSGSSCCLAMAMPAGSCVGEEESR